MIYSNIFQTNIFPGFHWLVGEMISCKNLFSPKMDWYPEVNITWSFTFTIERFGKMAKSKTVILKTKNILLIIKQVSKLNEPPSWLSIVWSSKSCSKLNAWQGPMLCRTFCLNQLREGIIYKEKSDHCNLKKWKKSLHFCIIQKLYKNKNKES